jgi:predicted RNA binding protein YcfA (HicA-like mRNA interferase family)
VKRRDLIKRIEALGAEFVRHGSNHDWYWHPATKIHQAVPRHQEVKEYVARSILKNFSQTPKFFS